MAKALAENLLACGVDVQMDKNRLNGGDKWESEIKEEIMKATLFVVLVSANSSETKESYYYSDIGLALKRQRSLKPKLKFVVPLRLDKASAEELRSYHWIDVERDNQDSIERVANAFCEMHNISPFSKKATDEISVTVAHTLRSKPKPSRAQPANLVKQISQRVEAISDSIRKTAQKNQGVVDETVNLFSEWMLDNAVARVVDAGRARLSGAIPANRLAHRGARVYVQDDIMPMPHTIKQGGIIAVSAWGRSASVLEVLKKAKKKNPEIRIVGIADRDAEDFRKLCHLFIGIEPSDFDNPLEALADSNEYVCSMLLDAIVLAAGNRSGFDDTIWGLGHENLGATGPYDLDDLGEK